MSEHFSRKPESLPNLSAQLEAVAAEFPKGRIVVVGRTIRDANNIPTGEERPEGGWVVGQVGLAKRPNAQGNLRDIVMIAVGSPDGKSHKLYRPEQLREYNGLDGQTTDTPFDVSEKGAVVEQDKVPSSRGRAMGVVGVRASELAQPPVVEQEPVINRSPGLPPAPKLDEPPVLSDGSRGGLPSISGESARQASSAEGEASDEVSPDEIKKFLDTTQADYDNLVTALDSNYRNGVEVATLEQIKQGLDVYATYLSKMFNLASRAEPYPSSRTLVGGAGEMRFQLTQLAGHDGMHSDLLGNMLQLLRNSRMELTAAAEKKIQ